MKSSGFVTEEKQNIAALILDVKGEIGEALAEKLKEDALVFFVSKKSLNTPNVVNVPYKRVLEIPDNNYSYIFVVGSNLPEAKKILEKMIEKSSFDKAVFIFLTDIEDVDMEILNFIKSYQRSKVIIYGDIFDNKTRFNTVPNDLVRQASKGKIKLSQDGTNFIYPIYFEDLISSVLEASVLMEDRKKVFLAFYKHPMTVLSFSHILQKINPLLKIDFKKEEIDKRKIILPEDGKYLIEEDVVENRLRKINPEESKQATEVSRNEFYKHSRLYFLSLILSLIIIPFILVFLPFFFGEGLLNLAKNNLTSGNFEKAYGQMVLSKKFLLFSQKSEIIVGAELEIFGKAEILDDFNFKIQEGIDFTDFIIYFFNGANNLQDIFLGKSRSPEQSLKDGQNYFNNAFVLFQKGKFQVNSFDKLDSIITILSNTINSWPEIFGFFGKKTYLILFQDNTKLRPGGGFISSYGLLTFDRGKISDFSMNNVYKDDEKLKGHVEPPFAIRRYLSSEHWYLRDSNFDVDFLSSAEKSAVFLNLETSRKVDAVLGIDFSFLSQIVSTIGPIYIDNYKEVVNKDNFFKLSQQKDFLKSFSNALILKFSKEKNLPYLDLAKITAKSIYEKHILFAFSDKNIQSNFTANGWSSTLVDIRDPHDINDFIGINEANLGINKVNYFIKRSISQSVRVESNGKINSTIDIVYRNTSIKKDSLGGEYKNYLRIILPLGSSLNRIRIDENIIETTRAIIDPLIYEAKNFKNGNKLEIENYDENNKTIFGFLINIPLNSEKKISVDYTLNKKFNLESSAFSYNIKFFKQPGTETLPYNFSFLTPKDYAVVSSTKDIIRGENSTFSKDVTSDFNLNLEFAKR